jgi:hypothetical protein
LAKNNADESAEADSVDYFKYQLIYPRLNIRFIGVLKRIAVNLSSLLLI